MKPNTIEEAIEHFSELHRAGCAPPLEAFIAEYPDFAEELRVLLEIALELDESSKPMGWPQQLGEFILGECLGTGGMGTVFAASQKSLNRGVAIKILSPQLAVDAHQRERFFTEARLIAGLHHPHIVQVYGAGSENGYFYYVMENIGGRALSIDWCTSVASGKELERRAAELVCQAAEALAYAHRNHIVHRDIKPGNLLLDNNGNIHVSDFGLAALLDDDVTRSIHHEGTLRYMAPERLTGQGDSYECDQYALGVVLFELLTGKAAFGDSAPATLTKKICEFGLPPWHGSRDLAKIIAKATARDPRDRFASVEGFAADLHRFLNGEPVQARLCPFFHRAWLWCKRQPVAATGILISIFLALVLILTLARGYWEETRLRLAAEENARIAREALDQVFLIFETDQQFRELLLGTPSASDLLMTLSQHYDSLLRSQNMTAEQLASSKLMQGKILLQSNPVLASELFASAVELYDSDSPGYWSALWAWAEAQYKAENLQEAQQAAERIVWHCSSAEDPSLLLLAMQAGNFLRFTGHPDADLYQEMTLALAKQILVDNPLQPVALRILLEVNDAGVDATGTAEDFFEDFL